MHLQRSGPDLLRMFAPGYSFSGSCISTSRQALTLRRRQTQQRPSDSLLAPGSPQTLQSKVLRVEGSKTTLLAEASNFGSTMSGKSRLFLVTSCIACLSQNCFYYTVRLARSL